MVTTKITEEALAYVKLASGETGEKIGVYLSRIAIERAKKDFETLAPLNAEKKMKQVEAMQRGEVPEVDQ